KEIKKLLDVFIEPTLVYKKTIQVENIKTHRSPIKYEFHKPKNLIENLGTYFIVGESGSGKSTLFRKLVLELIENSKFKSEYKQLPVYIRFKDIIDNQNVIGTIEGCLRSHNLNDLEF